MKKKANEPSYTVSLSYDADGNMTSDGRFHYFWNGENRLVMASNAEVVVTYAYDHRGRMVQKEISHEGTEARRMEYLWDGWNIIREIQWPVASDQWSVGTLATGHCPLVTDYVWGLDIDGTPQGAGGVGGLLTVVRHNSSTPNSPTPQLYFPTYDANGNVSEYISTNGEIVAHYDYSPFGEPLVASGPLAATFSHQFSTKPYCAVTGFSEYQMRKYRPEIGRWMSRDPIGEEQNKESFDLYSLCQNYSQNHYDYLGKSIDETAFIKYEGMDDLKFNALARSKNLDVFTTIGITSGIVFYIADCEKCNIPNSEENNCSHLVVKQDVAIIGVMAWRNGSHSGRSGRPVSDHERLHYSYLKSYAEKTDAALHKMHGNANGQCESANCCKARKDYISRIANQAYNIYMLNSAKLDYEDHPESDKPKWEELKKEYEGKKENLANLVKKGEEKVKEECGE